MHASIAFLGIGLMGQPMARRLLSAGYPLSSWNRSAHKSAALIVHGARHNEDLKHAVKDAQIVITMLEDGPTVLKFIEQAMPTLKKGTLVIDMSSTRQAEAQSLQAMLKTQGIDFIDAPVSGGVVGAEKGELAIMVGGSIANYQRAEELLQVMGRPRLVGGPGCGQLAKLCNQLIVGGTLSIVAEALLLAQAGGADPAAVRDAIRGGFAESRILEVHGQRMLDRNFMPGGQIKSQIKDMDNILAAAKKAGVQLPLTELATVGYKTLALDYAQADQSATLLALEKINPGKRLGSGPDQVP
jgi:2-hydroxy-3-oxopropionate reductase